MSPHPMARYVRPTLICSDCGREIREPVPATMRGHLLLDPICASRFDSAPASSGGLVSPHEPTAGGSDPHSGEEHRREPARSMATARPPAH